MITPISMTSPSNNHLSKIAKEPIGITWHEEPSLTVHQPLAPGAEINIHV